MSNLKFPSRRPLKTDPAEVISSGQVTLSGQWMSNPDLGAPVSEGHRQEIMLMAEREANKRLQAQLNLANKRLAEVEAPPPKAEASITNAKKLQQLAQDADSATARACILAACSARDVTLPVLTALLTQLSKNAAFKIKIKLPDDEDEMKKFTARVFKLADIDRDAILNEREFALLWHNLFKLEMETILCERYNAKMVAPASTFKFGTRQEWITGLQQKLGHLITRSVEAECTTNDGGVWRKPYEYFVKERARPEHRPGDGNDVEGKPIIFDEGHEGWSLSDFHAIAQTEKADARLNKVEVAILRMYTAEVRLAAGCVRARAARRLSLRKITLALTHRCHAPSFRAPYAPSRSHRPCSPSRLPCRYSSSSRGTTPCAARLTSARTTTAKGSSSGRPASQCCSLR